MNDIMEMPDVGNGQAASNSTNCSRSFTPKSTSPKLLNMKHLRAALRRRPEVLRFVMSLYRLVEKKKNLVTKLKIKIKKLKRKSSKVFENASSQTDNTPDTTDVTSPVTEAPSTVAEETKPVACAAWGAGDGAQKSIAEQVAEAAQSALAQTGMVYVESAGMYYDYKSGYYYNSELGLYYHSSTGCYYYYSEDKNEFTYHSHADTSALNHQATQNSAYVTPAKPVDLPPQTQELLKKKDKLRKHKKEIQDDKDGPPEAKRKKSEKKNKNIITEKIEDASKELDKTTKDANGAVEINNENGAKEINLSKKPNIEDIFDEKVTKDDETEQTDTEIVPKEVIKKEEQGAETDVDTEEQHDDEMEDGECSDTASEAESKADEGEDSDSTATDVDESVVKHHPPCMRIVVKQTNLPKLKIGTLFLVTKDGGTLGREGDEHAVLIRDENVSRIHLQLLYNDEKRCYEAVDLGSKNGSILNGSRLSNSQQVSQPVEVVHGSTLQVGETKLLCHVHPGSDTCGLCEPGLIMAAEDAEKRVAYTRTCDIKRQHALELARLKNRYAPEPLAIEEGTYNDRAKARRDNVGSSHHAEKTKQNDLDTNLAEDNKGFQMLSKMGWKSGAGLGKEEQGEKEPIALVSNAGTAGLGAGGTGAPGVMPAMTLAARARTKLKPKPKVFRDPLEEDD